MRLLKLRQRSAPVEEPPPSGDYPAVVVSLGIEDVYDLPGNVGYRSTPIKIPSSAALAAAYPGGEATWDATNFRVILAGTFTPGVTPRRTFSGWDLKAVKGYIEITRAGWTVSDNYVGPSATAGGVLNSDNYGIKTSNTLASHTSSDANSNVIIEYNTCTGYDEVTDAYYNSAHIASTADVTGVIVRRNRVMLSPQDSIFPRGNDWIVEYNHATISGVGAPAAHGDFLQILRGNNLIVRRNYIDQTPSLPPSVTSYGRTNAVRLEAFESGQTVNDARVEYNYVPGSDVLDVNGDPQFAIFTSTATGGGGAGTVSGNQFNFNAVALRASSPFNAIKHPTGSQGDSGTGNRNIADNTVISDWSNP